MLFPCKNLGREPVGRLGIPTRFWLMFVLILAGCQPAMRDQDRPHPQGYSAYFADHRDARAGASGAVPLVNNDIRAGVIAESPAAAATIPLTMARMERGQVLFNAFCSPCHGLAGRGDGLVVRHGFPQPPALQEARLQVASDAFLYGVITDGAGAMPAYNTQIPEFERWLIVAYVRALQLSQTDLQPAAGASPAQHEAP